MKPKIMKSKIMSGFLFFSWICLSNAQEITQIVSNCHFLIIAPDGKKTGFDLFQKKLYEEIPGTSYGDAGIEDEVLFEFITDTEHPLITGSYIIKIFRTREEAYRILFGIQRNNMDYTNKLTGTFGIDSTKIFEFVYANDPSIPILIQEISEHNLVSMIEKLIVDITNATNSGSIDNKGIANSLISKLEEAKKQLEKGKPKQAVNALNGFLNELSRQHEKHISDEVYGYLKEKVERLISQIESSG